ncbi:NUDIX domain-containing protein [Paenibacillus senegalensis]|uniref:NUDIX domain-containing protein n=1 Tax=Paenibacillus senegalensis TaxID=1465766 RepID=UPI0005A958B1|nr:NUDIX domain-containing protein [Paenibacillus senegalensis]
MIRMRLMTHAFLSNGNHTLMLKRAGSKKLAPNMWTGVGGHIEDGEQSNPELAVIREIEEETGITGLDLTTIELRYIMMRKVEDEIRQHFVYFAETSRSDFIPCDEGELSWIDTTKLLSLQLPLTIQKVLEHRVQHPASEDVFLGTILKESVQWSILDR